MRQHYWKKSFGEKKWHKWHKSCNVFNVSYLTAGRYMSDLSFEVEICHKFPHKYQNLKTYSTRIWNIQYQNLKHILPELKTYITRTWNINYQNAKHIYDNKYRTRLDNALLWTMNEPLSKVYWNAMCMSSEMKNTSNWDYTHCITVASLEMSNELYLSASYLECLIVQYLFFIVRYFVNIDKKN